MSENTFVAAGGSFWVFAFLVLNQLIYVLTFRTSLASLDFSQVQPADLSRYQQE